MLIMGWIANLIAFFGLLTQWVAIRKARRKNDEPHTY
jgi:hypothetical protein